MDHSADGATFIVRASQLLEIGLRMSGKLPGCELGLCDGCVFYEGVGYVKVRIYMEPSRAAGAIEYRGTLKAI